MKSIIETLLVKKRLGLCANISDLDWKKEELYYRSVEEHVT